MAVEALIARYGLLAILAGSGIEGEAVVLTGGILAHKGLLPIWGVAAAAAVGSCVVDQLWFWLARRFRDHARVRRAMARPIFGRAIRWLERFPTTFILSFRFIYGLRTIGPIAIGTSTVSSAKFVPLNMIAAAIWAPLIAWAGFAFGKAVDPWLHDVKSGVLLALGLAMAGVAAYLIVRLGKAAIARMSTPSTGKEETE